LSFEFLILIADNHLKLKTQNSKLKYNGRRMLETFTAFVHISDGVAQDTPGPGAAVFEPPKRAERARAHDRLFVLVELSAPTSAPTRTYRELVAHVGETYFQTPGSVTAALRKAVQGAHTLLARENAGAAPGTQITGGAACAVLRESPTPGESQLFVAQCGLPVAYLAHEGLCERYPPPGGADENHAVFGIDPEVDVHFSQEPVTAGDVLFMIENRITRLLTDARVSDLIADARAEDVMRALHNAVRDSDLRGLVVEFGKPVQHAAEAGTPAGRPKITLPTIKLPGQAAAAPGAVKTTQPAAAPAAAPRSPEPAGDSPQPSLGRRFMLGVSKLTGGAAALLAQTLPDAAHERRPLRAQTLVPNWGVWLAAILIPVLVATLTASVWWQQGSIASGREALTRANNEIVAAETLDKTDPQAARPHWEAALRELQQAEDLGVQGNELIRLRNEAQAALDRLDQVTRLQARTLRDFGENAQLRRVVARNLILYALESAGQRVYADDLIENDTALRNPSSQPIAYPGLSVDNRTITQLIDMAWLPAGGQARGDALVVLGANGVLFTYAPAWGLTATPLIGSNQWGKVQAATAYLDRLYLFDSSAPQIWRYEQSAQGFILPPTTYFPEGAAPDLHDVLDFSIDSSGNIYTLRGDGRIVKYFNGGETAFTISGVVDPLTEPSAFFVGPDPLISSIYVAEPRKGRIVRLSLGGTFLDQYKVDGDAFNDIRSFYVDEQNGRFFIASHSRVYVAYNP
jgi:hypothetical protein